MANSIHPFMFDSPVAFQAADVHLVPSARWPGTHWMAFGGRGLRNGGVLSRAGLEVVRVCIQLELHTLGSDCFNADGHHQRLRH